MYIRKFNLFGREYQPRDSSTLMLKEFEFPVQLPKGVHEICSKAEKDPIQVICFSCWLIKTEFDGCSLGNCRLAWVEDVSRNLEDVLVVFSFSRPLSL